MWGRAALTFLGGETLLANGSSLALPNNHQGNSLASRSICLRPPSSLPPSGGDGVAATPGPLPTSAWMWGWWR